MSDPSKRRPLVVIEEGTLTQMANNAVYLKEFPFLKSLAGTVKKKGGCGGCKAAQERSVAFTSAKVAIRGLPSDKIQRLKQLLNAQRIRVRYAKNGSIVEWTSKGGACLNFASERVRILEGRSYVRASPSRFLATFRSPRYDQVSREQCAQSDRPSPRSRGR